MIRLLLGLILIGTLFLLLQQSFPDSRGIKKITMGAALTGLLTLLIYMGITGRLHWLVSLLGSIIVLSPKLFPVLRYISPIKRACSRKPNPTENAHRKQPGSVNLTVGEACAILGLRPECSRAEIIAAHRRLIQKNHPDHGGSDYLAHQINQARERLLQQHDHQ